MSKVLNTSYEVIAVDGSCAAFIDESAEGLSITMAEFEETSGVTRSELAAAAGSSRKLFIQKWDQLFTVNCINSAA